MDKQIQNLKGLVDNYLHKSKEDILKEWGNPLRKSYDEIWFYNRYNYGIFKDEIAFLFEFKENHVTDIMITQYIFWKAYKNIFYLDGQNPEYKVMYL